MKTAQEEAEYFYSHNKKQFEPWKDASLDDLITFIANFREAIAHCPRLPNPEKRRFWGMSLEQMITYAQTLNNTDKRRAGVKALKRKYGHDVAENIVFKHSGRTIR